MRFLPTRIVLAALAFIVGAVLALPMLLARKAEAARDLPQLEAEAGIPQLGTTEHGLLEFGAPIDAGPSEREPLDPAGLCANLLQRAANETGEKPIDLAGPKALGPTPRRALVRLVAGVPSAPEWPAHQTFDRQRKYHLRP